MGPIVHSIQRGLLVSFIEQLTPGPKDVQNDSFITPPLAKRTIDYVHLLQHGASVPDDVSNQSCSAVSIGVSVL